MAWMVDLSRCNPFDGRFVLVSGLPDSRAHTSRECKCSRGRRVDPSPEFLHRCADGEFMVLGQDIFCYMKEARSWWRNRSCA